VTPAVKNGARRTYSPPQVRRLNAEQGALLLLGHAWQGDQEARELLELLFPEPAEQLLQPEKEVEKEP